MSTRANNPIELSPSLKAERDSLRQSVAKGTGIPYVADEAPKPTFLQKHLPTWLGGISTDSEANSEASSDDSLLDKYGTP